MTQTQSQALTTRDETLYFAEHAVKSGAFGDLRNVSQAVIKIELGRELGMSAIASLQGIMFNERGGMTLGYSLQGACLQRRGYSWKVIKHTDSECHLDIYRGDVKIGESTLTMQQATAAKMNMRWDKQAGAWKEKDTWKSYGRNMLFARCLTNAVKWFAPEVLAGVPMYDPDELEGLPPSEAVIDNDEAKRQADARNGNGKSHDEPPAPDLKPVSARNRALVSGLVDFCNTITEEAKGAAKMDDKQKAAFIDRVTKLYNDANAQLVLRDMPLIEAGNKVSDTFKVTRIAIQRMTTYDQNAPVASDADADEFDARTTAEVLAS